MLLKKRQHGVTRAKPHDTNGDLILNLVTVAAFPGNKIINQSVWNFLPPPREGDLATDNQELACVAFCPAPAACRICHSVPLLGAPLCLLEDMLPDS